MAKLTSEERQARRAKAILEIAQPPSLDTVLAGLAGITSMIPIGGGVMATAPDYIHPSDKGHERIAAVLVELGFAPVGE